MKIETELIVKNDDYDTDGICGIVSFNLPKISGLSHGQIVGYVDEYGESPIEELVGKKIRVTVEVIK